MSNKEFAIANLGKMVAFTDNVFESGEEGMVVGYVDEKKSKIEDQYIIISFTNRYKGWTPQYIGDNDILLINSSLIGSLWYVRVSDIIKFIN